MLIYTASLKIHYSLMLCLLTFVILKSNDVLGSRDDDDDDEDPYTTTDPKKREPSPCESKLLIARFPIDFISSLCLTAKQCVHSAQQAH